MKISNFLFIKKKKQTDNEVIDDVYEVQPRPETAKVEENVFYATSLNELSNVKLKQTFVESGSCFIVQGEQDDFYLMGFISPVNETPQAFTFVPIYFEEVPPNESKVEAIRTKRAVKTRLQRSEKIGNLKKKLQNSSVVQEMKNMMGIFFTSVLNMFN